MIREISISSLFRSFIRAVISHDLKNHDGRISRLENGPAAAYATSRHVAARRALLRALRTKSILFSAIARPLLAGTFVTPENGETSRSACVPIASWHQRPVTENRRKREQSRPRAAHNGAREKEMFAYAYSRVFRRKGSGTVYRW